MKSQQNIIWLVTRHRLQQERRLSRVGRGTLSLRAEVAEAGGAAHDPGGAGGARAEQKRLPAET